MSPASCARGVLETVPALMRYIRTQMRSQARSHRGADLSVPQLRALLFVDRHRGAALRSLAEHLGLTPPSASKLVEELVQRKLLARSPSTSDRRRIRLGLSPAGRRLLEAVLEKTHGRLSAALAALAPDELRAVQQGLAALRRCLAASPG